MSARELTTFQRTILGRVAWFGTVEAGAFVFTADDRDAHRKASMAVRALTRRGFLAHGKLTRRGRGVAKAVDFAIARADAAVRAAEGKA